MLVNEHIAPQMLFETSEQIRELPEVVRLVAKVPPACYFALSSLSGEEICSSLLLGSLCLIVNAILSFKKKSMGCCKPERGFA